MEEFLSRLEDKFMKIESLTHENYVKLFEDVKKMIVDKLTPYCRDCGEPVSLDEVVSVHVICPEFASE